MCLCVCFQRHKFLQKKKTSASPRECLGLDHCLSPGINETASPEEGGPAIDLIFGDTLLFFLFLVFFFLVVVLFSPLETACIS